MNEKRIYITSLGRSRLRATGLTDEQIDAVERGELSLFDQEQTVLIATLLDVEIALEGAS